MLAEGRSLIRQRNAIEDRAVELLGERPDYQLLRTIPGIGPINALTILAETGDLRRFRHHRQFLKFCGMRCPAGDCGAICREGIWPPSSQECSAVEAKSQSMVMLDYDARYGWWAKQRF